MTRKKVGDPFGPGYVDEAAANPAAEHDHPYPPCPACAEAHRALEAELTCHAKDVELVRVQHARVKELEIDVAKERSLAEQATRARRALEAERDELMTFWQDRRVAAEKAEARVKVLERILASEPALP